ncbi:Gp33 protein [Clostridium phage phi3626]|nr:Gp33 protein [Clostridium phage phi3626]AAL96803.1 Gp33 protein [Clostridium phage phi3626]
MDKLLNILIEKKRECIGTDQSNQCTQIMNQSYFNILNKK